MKLVLTALIFLAGLLFAFLSIGFLFNPATSAAGFGLEATSTRGLAAVRADFTAFFLVSGIAMMWGAWKRNGTLLLVPAALFGVAFIGRLVSALVDGRADDFWVSMLVEAVVVILMLVGSRVLPHRDTTGISNPL